MKHIVSLIAFAGSCALACASTDLSSPGAVNATISPFANLPTVADGLIFANAPSASPASLNLSWRNDNNANMILGQSFVLTDSDYKLDAVMFRYTGFSPEVVGHDYLLNIYAVGSTGNGSIADGQLVYAGAGSLPDSLGSGPRNITFTLDADAGIVLSRNTYYVVTFGFASPTAEDAAKYIKFETVGSGVVNADGGYRYGSSTGLPGLAPVSNNTNGASFYVIGSAIPPVPESSTYSLIVGFVLLSLIGGLRLRRRSR